ncbi:glycoside hydrolase family 19 protein [Pseudomonas gingeri]|uniref:glycoside hydrolase family 19 protein n=1 Tax=Pseudomonas gingeri TaxID=117681 RepID=UPI0015A33DE2|nr:glycoside hydrolase family 19 protein [Pseudomonas gingeri]NWD03936.1 glycoside hydrolase family 19 protein [Pseudomonas gingeri]NWE33734.1 glycoside hydrolase family 19 protein [Pseudomonas gingeri]NWE58180.1 glycoside hydrolase family 19 protein [Pseudomonas gingeri]NWF04539.1 glycoside hydrolase family 19 protein [Pseudomonas gingeri]
MTITLEVLRAILPKSDDAATLFIDPLNEAMQRYAIDSPLRIAAFLAQVGYESEQLRVLSENLDYSAAQLVQLWKNRFDCKTADECAYKPDLIANIAYASRYGNGPADTGDGWKYRGRGLIQLTFHDNYRECDAELELGLIDNPGLLAEPSGAALSAGWFWKHHNLNDLADKGNFEEITQEINGGSNGANQRLALYHTALQVLKVPVQLEDADNTAPDQR